MSNQFLKLRRSAVPGRIPSTSSIDFGEIALNTFDGLAFIKKSGSNGEEVITLGSREGAFTGSFSGSFVGNGAGLFNIPASGIVGLNLSQIATGSVTASVSTGAGSFSLVSGSSTFLYVSSSGNVGIGTASPAYSLDVAGNIRANAVAFGTTQSPVISGVNGSLYHDINSTTYNYIWRRSSELMRLTGTGNLLLNTTSDDTVNKLQVSGSAKITNGLVVTGSITSNTSVYSPVFEGPANVIFRYANNNTYVQLENTGLVPNGIIFNVNNTSNAFKFRHASNYSFTLGYNDAAGAAWFGNNTSLVTVNPSAQVQIDSTTKGVLLPRMTQAQRLAISAPAQGLLVYDIGSTTEGLWYYNSGSNPGWQGVLTNSGSQTISGSITANNITVTGTLTAQTIVAQTITSSTDYVSGSTIFGNSLSNTHQFTGSVSITGSLSVNGSPAVTGTGVAGQVAYWTGTSAQSGSNNLTYSGSNINFNYTGGSPGASTYVGGIAFNNTDFIQQYLTYAYAQSTLSFGKTLSGTTSEWMSNDYNGNTSVGMDSKAVTIFGNSFLLRRVRTVGSIQARLSILVGEGNYSSVTIAAKNDYYAYNHNLILNATNAGVENINQLVLSSAGNVGINTPTDTGERLQVSGSSRFAGDMVITGSSASSGNALIVRNGGGSNIFRVQNDLSIFLSHIIYVGQNTTNTLIYPFDGNANTTPNTSGRNFGIFNSNTNQTGDQSHFALVGNNLNPTSGDTNGLLYQRTFVPTSGTATYKAFHINPTINQTGGANGITRGLYINPTITAAADFRTIEWSTNAATSPSQSWGLYGAGTARNYLAGVLLLNQTATTYSERLQVNGTTRLFSTVMFGTNTQGAVLGSYANTASSFDSAGINLLLYNYSTSANSNGYYHFGGENTSYTSGDASALVISKAFAPSSGTGTYTALRITPTIHQTGGASGTTRGLYVTPSLVNPSDYRAVEWSNNAVTAPSASWGLYGAGTAPNYLAGTLSIGTTGTNQGIRIGRTPTGADSNSMLVNIAIPNTVTTNYRGFLTSIGLNSTGFTLPSLSHFEAVNDGGFTAGVVTNLYGFKESLGTYVATNVYGFYGAIPAATGRWSLYMAGSATNFLAGNLLIGTTSDDTVNRLQVSGSSRFIGNMIVSGSGSAILNVYNNVNSSSLFQVGGSQNTNVSVNTQVANRFQLLTISRIGDPTTAAISLGVGTGPTSTSGVISVNNDSLILGYNIGNTFTETVRFTTNQNLLLGTTSDDTFNRLQVSGSSRFMGNMVITGSGNTSATNALTVQNSGSTNLFVVSNDGSGFLKRAGNSSGFYLDINGESIRGGASGNISLGFGAGSYRGFFQFGQNHDNGNGDNWYFGYSSTALSNISTTGNNNFIGIQGNFRPTSGTASYSQLSIYPTINQTGGANGITRGLYVVPTLTNAADWRSIEWTNNASATSGSWGLYGSGSAPNYLNGGLFVGSPTPASTEKFGVYQNTPNGILAIRIQNLGTTTNTISQINLSTNTNSGTLISSVIQSVATDAIGNSALTFINSTSGTASEKMRIASTGNVLINSTTDDTFNRLQVSGSTRISQALTASLALISGSGSQRLTVQGSGSSILTVDGALGRLFSVDDAASGSLFSVNTISGLPIMEAFSDNTVRIGQFGQRALFVSQSRVGIGKEDSLNATLDVSGSMALTGSFNHQGNYTTTGVITAQTLVISTISSSVVYSSGSNVFGNDLSNTQVLTGSVSITGSLTSNGNVVIRGSGDTSATTGLTITNSSSQNILRVLNNGEFKIGNSANFIWAWTYSSDYNTPDINGTNFALYPAFGTVNIGGGTHNHTSGNQNNIITKGRFQPTSGTATFADIRSEPLINQTGGANGITRGLLVNPTLNSAWDYRSIEWTNNASSTSGSWGLYGAGSAPNYLSGSLGIGTTTPSASIDLGGSGSRLRFSQNVAGSIFHGIEFATSGVVYSSLLANQNTGEVRLSTNATYFPTFYSSGAEAMRISTNRNLLINSTTDDTFNRLQVTGNARISQALTASQAIISGSGTQRLTVVGSGSAQPLFTVQGSQGELFSIVDSLSGSLFSVNDQSGLPIMEVFSDNTILMGNYLDPMLLTTTRTGSAAGINTIYSLPTSSYDAVYIDYTIRSGSNARAGNFMAMWSGTSVNFTDNSITEFGSTSTFTFGAHVSGANMVVTGSAPTAGWTIKTIIKAI